MRELAHLVVSELHLRAFFVGLGILLGFNYGIQYKPSVVSFIATIGSSGPTLSLPEAAPGPHIDPSQSDFFFPSRSVSASFRATPSSTTIFPAPPPSTLHWFVSSQDDTDPALFEVSSKSSFSESACNSTNGSTKGHRLCPPPEHEAIRPYFEALTRVFIAKRSPQNAEEARKEGITDLILHPIYSTSASQKVTDWNIQATHGFGLVDILVFPTLLAIAIRLAVYVGSVIASTVLDLIASSVTLCAYSTRVCRAILVFLKFSQRTPLGLTPRQGRLRRRHRKKGVLPPSTISISLRPPDAMRTFLYAPEQRVRLEHVILRNENTSASIPSSKDLFDPRYLVVVKTLGNGSDHAFIVKNVKKKNGSDAQGGQLLLKTVPRFGGYRLLQFAQELRALDRLQKSRWCPKLVASFAGPEDLHMIMTYYPRGDLAHFIKDAGGQLSRAQAKYYLVELFIAIRAIHKMGVFHRGITLENLLLTGSAHLVVSDFRKSKINYDSGLSEYDSFRTAISQDGFRDYYAMIKVYYKMVTGNPLIAISFKRLPHNVTKDDNSFFKLLLKPFSENRTLPTPMDVRNHAIFDRVNWDAMEKQLVAVPPSSLRGNSGLSSQDNA